jgi:hypothetical protein
MRDDQDPLILRLFAEQDQSPPPDDFMRRLGERIDAQQRVQGRYRVLATIACVVLAAVSAPWIAQITSNVIELALVGISSPGPIRDLPPLTWVLIGATAAGCTPVLYLWRTGRW